MVDLRVSTFLGEEKVPFFFFFLWKSTNQKGENPPFSEEEREGNKRESKIESSPFDDALVLASIAHERRVQDDRDDDGLLEEAAPSPSWKRFVISTERLCRDFESYCTGKKKKKRYNVKVNGSIINDFDFSLSDTRYIYIYIGDANDGEDVFLTEIGIEEQRFEM